MSSPSTTSTERLDDWRSVLSQAFVPLEPAELGGAEPGRFRGILRATEFDGLQLAEVAGTSQAVHRSSATIRKADPGRYKIGLQVCGNGLLVQDGREASLAPGDFALYDTTRPYRLRFDAPFRMLVIMCPRGALPLPQRLLGDRTAVAVPGHERVGAMVAPFLGGLRGLLDNDAGPHPIAGGHLGPAVLSSLAAAFDDRPTPEAYTSRSLLVRSRAYIEDHLGDSALGPESVAAAQHVSLRYLHRLFESDSETVAGWIRARRLERCRRDLSDPRLAQWPVSAVAARWGLVNAAHFSRVFRATYGVSPREYRAATTASAVLDTAGAVRSGTRGVPTGTRRKDATGTACSHDANP